MIWMKNCALGDTAQRSLLLPEHVKISNFCRSKIKIFIKNLKTGQGFTNVDGGWNNNSKREAVYCLYSGMRFGFKKKSRINPKILIERLNVHLKQKALKFAQKFF